MRVESVKRRVKEIVGEALLRTGLWRRHLEGMARRGEAILLTYHRVIEKWDRTLDYSQPAMVVTAETFDRQLTFLKKHFHIVPLSFFLNPTPNTQHQKPVCCVTFDDGWRDNYEIAFPILRNHDVPATIFLTTDFIGTNRTFWHTRLIYVLLHGELSFLMGNDRVLQFYPAAVRHRLMHLAGMGESPSAQDVDPIIRFVEQTCDQDTLNRLIQDLAALVLVRRSFLSEGRFFLDWNEIREMAGARIEMGSHGCSHRSFPGLNVEETEEEFGRSKAEIERRIDKVVYHFAFPYGAANRDHLALAAKAGYRTACLSGHGFDERGFGSLGLRRLGMHEAVSMGNDGSFSNALFCLWLVRAPRMRICSARGIRQSVEHE